MFGLLVVWSWVSDMNYVALHVKTYWNFDDFAQASSSHLSENTINSPLSLHEVSS